MRSEYEQKDPMEPDSYRELHVLKEVEITPDISQRDLSRRLGIALGLTNVLLRNLGQKGYIRASKAGWKRWIYALTPDGFSRKLALTVSYVHRVLNHYQGVRQTLREELHPLALNKESHVAIYGTGEFAELVYLGLKELGIEEIGVYSRGPVENERFLGMPVHDISILDPEGYERVVIASLRENEQAYIDLRQLGLNSRQVVAFFKTGAEQEWE